ncbi:TPA: phage tail protein, partial [Citrobacter freundii]|nr:phage tail protein [Citrobacter freundii]HAT2254755.1 phage tail protein [Citrobacter freundii]HAT2265178.1 phage tail protein [Citrobacter freundii]HAT2292659.1 phage tail protein [Citrobacter freundii]HAT2379705.1 phage tail protein [Citrobacter freundii]
ATLLTLVQQVGGSPLIRKHYNNGNTTIDSNGNLKPASPVIKLKGDGTAEFNEEAEGVMTERIDTGIYKISGVLGFHSEPIWGGVDGGFVIPANTNGLPLLWVDYEIDPDGSITLKTYHRTHHSAPKFARNLIGIKNEDGSFTETVQDGEPVDIPAGRWVDLRVEMPRNSLWNIKQQEVQEAREIAERKRQQNQQDTHP